MLTPERLRWLEVVCKRRARNRSIDYEDLYQDVCLALLEKQDQLRLEGARSEEAVWRTWAAWWVFKMGQTACNKVSRQRRIRAEMRKLPKAEFNPWEGVDTGDTLQYLWDSMDDEDRMLVETYIRNETQKDAAEELGIHTKSLYRVLLKIRSFLEDRADD